MSPGDSFPATEHIVGHACLAPNHNSPSPCYSGVNLIFRLHLAVPFAGSLGSSNFTVTNGGVLQVELVQACKVVEVVVEAHFGSAQGGGPVEVDSR